MTNACILCGKCLEVCPLMAATRREELSPRAKADLFSVLHTGAENLLSTDVATLVSCCLGCQRCQRVCSKKVRVPALVAELRAAHPHFKGWVWKMWLSHARQLWRISSTTAQCIPERFQADSFGKMLKMLVGLKRESPLNPCVSVQSFAKTYQGRSVLLFSGCTARYVKPYWEHMAQELLEGLGVEVLPSDFQCCGGSLKAAGFFADAEKNARLNVANWRQAANPLIVTFCGSCHSALSNYDIFDSPEERTTWQESLVSLSQMLEGTAFNVSDREQRIGYHRPCHTEKQDSDFVFLDQLLGEQLEVATRKECCGFGGVMRLSNPEVLESVNAQCWSRLSHLPIVVTGCSACVSQLSATAPPTTRVGHWLDLLAAPLETDG